MTPRENMLRAIRFQKPQRLPINGYGPASDSTWTGPAEVKPPQAAALERSIGPGARVDQWLCQWEVTKEPNMGQVKGHPLANLDAMKDYPFPDGNDPRRYKDVPAVLAKIHSDPATKDKFIVCGHFMLLWERLQALHGFENCMMDMMDDDPRIHELADRITDYNLAEIRNMAGLGRDQINAFNFSEDWGTQTDTHVSPALFRSFFMPRYKRIFEAAHDQGWVVWMHSCGKINKFLAPLVELKLDLINMQQPRTNGIAEVGRQFAGKICFETLCDIQVTLPGGDRGAIATEAEELMRSWGTPNGGFILGDYGDARAIGAREDVKSYMLETFKTRDPWTKGW